MPPGAAAGAVVSIEPRYVGVLPYGPPVAVVKAGVSENAASLTREEAAHHNLRHVVTNVLGGGQAGVQVDVQRVDLESGDVLLLCSDGLTGAIKPDEILAELQEGSEPGARAERLVSLFTDISGSTNAIKARAAMVTALLAGRDPGGVTVTIETATKEESQLIRPGTSNAAMPM